MSGGGGLPEWAYAFGPPPGNGVIREQAGDFRVQELPLAEPAGEGAHLWLEIEKCGANTRWVAGELARSAGVAPREVGFAGMKDRHGVTSQWFSIGMQEAACGDWGSWEIEGVRILQARRHTRKLKRGALLGNRFHIVVRDLQGDTGTLQDRLERVARRGVPNYFGEQRFGFSGRNVGRGLEWLEKGGRLPRGKRSIYLSAVRSWLFNRVLSERVAQGNWDVLLDGDVAMLDGSRSQFSCRLPDAELERRCTAFDIHPSGPLPGSGGRVQTGYAAAEIENAVLGGEAEVIGRLAAAGVEAGRRSLRLRPANFEWQRENKLLTLAFDLPPGAYATSVLRELVSARPGTISEKR